MTSCRLLSVSIVAAVVLVLSARALDAGVYNLRLVTDNAPDYTDLESFVQTATAGCRTPDCNERYASSTVRRWK